MTITLGTQKQVDAGSAANRCVVVELTSSTGIAIYSTSGSGLQATHLTVSSGVITLGAELTIDGGSGSTPVFVGAKLTSTSIIIVYGYASGSVRRSRVISASGTTLTAESSINLTDALATTLADNVGLATLTTTSAIFVYRQDTNVGKARILTVSGVTVTENASFQFDTNVFQNKVTTLTTTKAVVIFMDGASSNRPTAEVLDISGTTITGNTDKQITTDTGNELVFAGTTIGPLTSTTVLTGWVEFSTSESRAAVLTESGGTLTVGSELLIEATSGVAIAVAVITSVRAIFGAKDSSNDIIFHEVTITGTTITEDDTDTVSSTATAQSISIAPLSSGAALAVWEGSIEAISLGLDTTSKLWLFNAVSWSDIGDPIWSEPVRGVFVKPGTAYLTIWASTGTGIYKTIDGGTNWTLKATLTFTPADIHGMADDDRIIAYNKDAAGTNRVALIDDTTITYIDSGHSTTGEGSTVRAVA